MTNAIKTKQTTIKAFLSGDWLGAYALYISDKYSSKPDISYPNFIKLYKKHITALF